MTDEEFDAFLAEKKAEHGRVLGFHDPDLGPLVFRSPRRPETKRYIKAVTGSNPDFMAAGDNLALACVVHPSREQLSAMMDERPTLGLSVAAQLQDLAGVGADGKKL